MTNQNFGRGEEILTPEQKADVFRRLFKITYICEIKTIKSARPEKVNGRWRADPGIYEWRLIDGQTTVGIGSRSGVVNARYDAQRKAKELGGTIKKTIRKY